MKEIKTMELGGKNIGRPAFVALAVQDGKLCLASSSDQKVDCKFFPLPHQAPLDQFTLQILRDFQEEHDFTHYCHRTG